MNGNGSPHAKLLLVHAQGMTDGREDEERNGIEDEDGAQRYTHVAILRLEHGAHSGYGTATANGGTGADEVSGVAIYLEEFLTNEPADEQGAHHRDDREGHTLFARG